MRDYTLERLFDLQMGKTPARDESSYWSDGIHDWISIRDLTNSDKYINVTNEKISDIAVKKTGIRLIPQNTVIMSFKLSIGKVAITSKDMYSNEAIMAFHDKKVTEIIPEYLYYLLLGHKWDEGSNKAVMGITLNKATLSKIIVSIHETKTQNKIVTTLGLLDQIIKNKKQQLSEYDQLIKSRFVEMFGSEIKETALEDVCLGITDGSHNPPKGIDYSENVMLSSQNINDRQITFDNPRYLSNEDFQKENKRTRIQTGDVLLTIVGSIGRTAIVPKNFGKITLQRSVAVLHPDFKKITATYLEQALVNIRHIIESESNGVAQKGIYLKQVRNLKIKYPPIDMQIKFEDFVQQVDKLKFEVQKSLEETQMLFDSLMQEYFG